jgi:ubiquinone/menaquinone biosynthesis C-methylase UbiE
MSDDFYTRKSPCAELKRIEQKIRDEQADTYLSWFGPYTNQIEFDAVRNALKLQRGDILADLGCGTGRFTMDLARLCKRVIAIDYSFESLLRAKERLEMLGIENVDLIQADITLLPLCPNSFDKVVSSQVFTLLPGCEARNAACSQAAGILKPMGKFALTVFNNHLYRKIKLLRGIPGVYKKEGTHPVHGFYYFNFSRRDLRALVTKNGFCVDKIEGLCNFPREKVKDYRNERWPYSLIYRLDELLGKTAVSYLLGDLLIASVHKGK